MFTPFMVVTDMCFLGTYFYVELQESHGHVVFSVPVIDPLDSRLSSRTIDKASGAAALGRLLLSVYGRCRSHLYAFVHAFAL